MFRMSTLFPLLGALALVGCGGNLCERQKKDAEACGQTVSDEDMQACEDALANCSKDDEKALNEMMDCIQDLSGGECGTDTSTTVTSTEDPQQLMDDMMACMAPVASVSAECLDAAGGTGGTTPTTTTGS